MNSNLMILIDFNYFSLSLAIAKGKQTFTILLLPSLSDRNYHTVLISPRYIDKCIKNSNLMILINFINLSLSLAIAKGK